MDVNLPQALPLAAIWSSSMLGTPGHMPPLSGSPRPLASLCRKIPKDRESPGLKSKPLRHRAVERGASTRCGIPD